MNRRLVKIAVLLLLGAIVNVAVAWGLAVWSGRIANVWIDSPEAPEIPPFVERTHRAYNSFHSWSGRDARSGFESFGFDIYTLRTLGTRDHHLQTTALVVGWPAPSLCAFYSYYVDNITDTAKPVLEERTSGILFRDRSDQNGWWIPRIAVWPGFAINTIFYAAILWVVFFAPGMVKRTLRRRRGQCPACAYPMGASPVCTECGRPIPSR